MPTARSCLPNPPLNSDPACIAFRSLSASRFLGSAQRLGAGGAGYLPSLGLSKQPHRLKAEMAMLTKFTHVLERMKSQMKGRKGTETTLSFDFDGIRIQWLTMENEASEASFPWTDVVAALAYKRDCFAVDLMCLTFTLSDDREYEINEEIAGWQLLVDQLPSFLPGSTPYSEWWHKVAVPAFALNFTVIFHRPWVPRPNP
jgi:hypothetical protein